MNFKQFVARFLLVLMAGLLPQIVSAAPIIDNNAGSWLDQYNDNLGVSETQQTVVDSAVGVVRLQTGQGSGHFTTVRVKPTSFNAWGRLRLEGTWASSSQVVVSLLDPLNGDTAIPGFTNLQYNGAIDLAGLSPTTHPEIKVRVALASGAVAPSVNTVTVLWSPLSLLLVDKMAAAEVLAGQRISYRIRYSTSFVEAKGLVVWDRLPHTAQGTMTYPQNFGQDDNLVFVSATNGGQYTATALTVKGVNIPANSVYWDLGTVKEGTTDTLTFVLGSKNGTLDGTTVTNTAHADATNAAAVSSSPAVTVIKSVPDPVLVKRAGSGIYPLGSENFTQVGTANCFRIEARNSFVAEGRETMYQAVVYDNLSDLVGKMDPDFGGSGLPVRDISPAGGTYVANYTPPTGGASFPAVVWNVGTMSPGSTFAGSFCVKLLGSPPLASPGQYVNTVCLDSVRTRLPLRSLTPLCRDLLVKWPLDETPRGSFAKGDNLDGFFQITANMDDDRLINDFAAQSGVNQLLYVKPGGTFPYGLRVRNSGLSAMNHVVLLDKIPDGVTFRSAWFTDPWLQANAKIFYSLTDTANPDTPPGYDYSQAPADLDPQGQNNWYDYQASPPANPADVRWVAFYVPAVNSSFFDSTAAGWIPGAPQEAIGFFDVNVPTNILGTSPCVDKVLNNRGLFRAHAYTPVNGGSSVSLATALSSHDDEPTRVSIDKPVLDVLGASSVSPGVLQMPGELTYSMSVGNFGATVASGATVEINWPKVPVNGVPQLLSFVNVTPANIADFDPVGGKLTVTLGPIPPGSTVPVSLTVAAPGGIDFGTELNFSSKITLLGSACPQASVPTQASAVAEMRPILRVFKNDVLDLIPSGGFLDYRLTLYNLGNAPSHGTFVVDRVPAEMVLEHVTGPQGERVWFSSVDSLPPGFLTPFQPIDAGIIASRFSPGIRDDKGTPGDPSDDTWTSPFGTQTRWVAWEMDMQSLSPPMYPVGQIHEVGMRVRNDLDGPGAGNSGSPSGNVIFNTTGVFSDELLQAIGNEVVTTIKDSPGILVQKSGPAVVASGQNIAWNIEYYNNSGTPTDIVTITDTLPAGVTFVSASHNWNAAAQANGAPSNNNGQPVASSVTLNPDGTTTVVFEIAGAAGYRGNGTDLGPVEGGRISVVAQVAPSTPSNTDVINRVTGTGTNGAETVTSSDEHLVMVRNSELRLVKTTSAEFPVAGDEVIYTLILSNRGLMPASNVVITDTLPANVTFVPGSTRVLTAGYVLGPPSVSGQTISWSAANGNALTKAPLAPGVLPASSGDVAIQYRVTIDIATPPGTTLPNTATVTTDTPEDGTEPNEGNQSVTTPHPDPVVSKSGPVSVQPGERFTWTLSYWNATRQPATGTFVIDSLPDYTGDGEADVTFVGQSSPSGVTPYYSSAPVGTPPPFDFTNPTANGWSATPSAQVNHIAWRIGNLGALAGPFDLTVTADAIRRNGGTPVPLPAGVSLNNVATISAAGTDNNPGNNTDNHITSTPGNDIALTKSGSVEGAFPGVAPGDSLVYTLTVQNSGTQVAYGVKIEDSLPVHLALESPGDNFQEVSLVNELGDPVQALDPFGQPILGALPVTRIANGSTIQWFLGSASASDPLYYRKVGLPPGSRSSFQVFARVRFDAPNGTQVTNSATVFLLHQDDSVPPEENTGNNTDQSSVLVYSPDLAIRKSVIDGATGSSQWTEAGSVLNYRIDYTNLGYAPARNSVISEVVPAGTSLLNVSAPAGSSVTYYPGPGLSGATSFDVNLGTVNAPANLAGVTQNMAFDPKAVIKLSNNNGGVPSGSFLPNDYVTSAGLTSIGDVDADGIPDLLLSAPNNDDGGTNSGGAWVMLMNGNGTVKVARELANGKNGIPAGSFQASEWVGSRVERIGDIDGDGVPDIAVGAFQSDGGAGAVWIIRLNSNGTAKSAVEIAGGKGGMASGALTLEGFGSSLAALGDVDGDGVPDLFASSPNRSDGAANSGGGWVLLLNQNGTAKATIKLTNGNGGIPAGTFSQNHQAGLSSGSADFNQDGTGDLVVGIPYGTLGGGCVVILLNSDGTASSVKRLASGLNGVPSGILQGGLAGIRLAVVGDVDSNGVPDLVLYSKDGVMGFATVVLMNPDGSAKGATVIANGQNGLPAGTFTSNQISDVSVAGDVDRDGVPDLLLGASGLDQLATADVGGAWVILLNPDGSVKAPVMIDLGRNLPPGTLPSSGLIGHHAASIGDLNGDFIPDFALACQSLSDSGPNTGGAYVVLSGWLPPTGDDDRPDLLDGANVSNGRLRVALAPGGAESVTTLANGVNGVPAGMFAGQTGVSSASLGEINGAPAVVLGAQFLDGNRGGAYVVRLNPDGTALSVVRLVNNENGIPAGTFDGRAGGAVTSLGQVWGYPAILLGAASLDSGRGGGYVVFLNPATGQAVSVWRVSNGFSGVPAGTFLAGGLAGSSCAFLGELNGRSTIMLGAGYIGTNVGGGYVIQLPLMGSPTGVSVVTLANGMGGIPSGTFVGNAGVRVASLGQLDGAPAVMMGAHSTDSNSGGCFVVRLNQDGTAQSVVRLTNGLNGIPAQTFAGQAGISLTPLGELDGAPAVFLGARQLDNSAGGGYLLRLSQAGQAISVVKLANGLNGIPLGTFGGQAGDSSTFLGQFEGAPALLMGARDMNGMSGGAYVVRLHEDGTARSIARLANGENGIPAGLFGGGAGRSVVSLGSLGGRPAFMLTAEVYAGGTGGAFVVRASPGAIHQTGTVEKVLAANSGFNAWDRLFSSSEIPDGTTLTYSIGRMVNGVPTYNLGPAWTNIAGPLPAGGLDLSSLPDPQLVVKVDFATTQWQGPGYRTPVVQSLFATYHSPTWPGFNFTVRVNDPVAFGQSQIVNTVGITTDTPEIRYDNNTAGDNISIRLTDLAVTKSVNVASAYPGDPVMYTLGWRNNGPQDAVNAVLTDTLPAGLSFVSSSPPPTSVNGQVLTWNLGNVPVSASGLISLQVGISPSAQPDTYTNVVRIGNERQETTLANNEDSVPVVVVPSGSPLLANVTISKTGPSTAALGGNVTFTLDYSSNGGGAANDVQIMDLLPDGLIFQSSSPAPTNVNGQVVTWNLGTLAAGASGTISVTATVGSNFLALHNQSLVNQSQITTTSVEVNLSDNQDTHTVTALGAPAALGGLVWHDMDRDGVIDAGEPMLPNVLVTLSGTDVFGNPVAASQLTGPGGAYSFTGLIPGTYQVVETQPSGFISTMDVLGTVYNLATGTPPGTQNGTNANPLDDVLSNIVLNSGDRGVNYNFGEVSEAVSIGSFVWNDANNNGLQDSGEAGLPGVSVRLLVKDGTGNFIPATNLSGSVVPSVVTTAAGTYFFGNLPSGTYRLSVTPPGGQVPSTTQNGVNGDSTPNDSNIAGPGSVAGSFDSGEFSLSPGQMPVESGGLAGDGSDNAAELNGNMTVDFGFYQPASLGDYVWIDADGDGNQDAGEAGLNGVTVELLNSAGTVVATTVTADNPLGGGAGYYLFDHLVSGTYLVRFVRPTGYVFTTGAGAVDETANSDADITTGLTGEVTLAPGDVVRYVDAGLYQPASLGDYVWLDSTKDGQQNEAPSFGLNGVVVDLLDAAGGVAQTTTTSNDANGNPGYYGFGNLMPGSYSVRFTPPSGLVFTIPSGVLGDPANSDADRVTGQTVQVTLASGEHHRYLDAGLKCPDTWADWKLLHPGQGAGGNLDGDAYQNFAEYAFAMPDSGSGSPHLGHTAWIIRPSTVAPGTLEAVFVRPVGWDAGNGMGSVNYTLQYAANAGSPTVWQSLVISDSNSTVSDNGDCTETVTIHDLENLTGLTTGGGIVRIEVTQVDPDGPDSGHVAGSEAEGWTETPLELCCRTYNVPYQRETRFTGRVASVNGTGLAFGAGDHPSASLEAGQSYYLEVLSGDHEGERFDVVGGSGNSLTLATDPDIHAAAAPFNTLAGPPPATLVGDLVALRRHWTLAEVFPPASFGATGSLSTAEQVQVFAGGVWSIYWLYDEGDSNPATARWVLAGDSSLASQGGTVIPPGQGMFFNNRSVVSSILSYGEVRANRFVRPLAPGNNLVGGGYPVDQSAAGAGSRDMIKARGFFGSRDFKTADSIFLWNADADINGKGYSTYYLLDGAPIQPALVRWVKVGDSMIVARDSELLMKRNRAVFVRARGELGQYRIPAPWSP